MKIFIKILLFLFLFVPLFSQAQIDYLGYSVIGDYGTYFSFFSHYPSSNGKFAFNIYSQSSPLSQVEFLGNQSRGGFFSIAVPRFIMNDNYSVYVSNDPQPNAIIPIIIPPKVISESGIAAFPTANQAQLRASVWTSEGKPVSVQTWFEWWIVGGGKNTTAKVSQLSNSLFSTNIIYAPGKSYCFIPYAQKLDSSNKPMGSVGKGREVCFPNSPFVETLDPVAVQSKSAYFKGNIVSFRGINPVIGFFERYYKNNPNNKKKDGFQYIYKPSNSDSKEFGYLYSDFDTDKNGPYCYKACAKNTPPNALVNCGEEVCFPETKGQDQDYFKVFKAAEALTKLEDCEKALITIDVYCQGKQPTSIRPNLDVVILIDKSGTMKGVTLDKTKQAVTNFIDKLDTQKDRVSVVSFSDWGRVENVSGLTNNFNEVKNAALAIQVSGNSTNLGDGFKKANTLFVNQGRADALRKIVLITDGIVNAGQNGEAPDLLSYPVTDNIYTNYAISQANIAKSNHQATIYVIRYSEPVIDQAHVQAAAFSKRLLKNIASPDQYYEAPIADTITQLFATVSYSIIQTKDVPVICKDVKVADILTDGSKFDRAVSSPSPQVNGQTLIWDLGTFSGHRRIEFIVKYKDASKQLAEKYPDSKVTYTDHNNVKQTVVIPKTEINDLVKCEEEIKSICEPCKNTIVAFPELLDFSSGIKMPMTFRLKDGFEKFNIKEMNLGQINNQSIATSDCIVMFLSSFSSDDRWHYGSGTVEFLSPSQKNDLVQWTKDGGKLIIVLSDYSHAGIWDFEWLPYPAYARDGADLSRDKLDGILFTTPFFATEVVIDNSLFSNKPNKPNYINDQPSLWENVSWSRGDDWLFLPLRNNEWWGAVTMEAPTTVTSPYRRPFRENDLYSFAYSKYYGKGLVFFNGVDLDGASSVIVGIPEITTNSVAGQIFYHQLNQPWDKKKGEDKCGLTYDYPIPKFEKQPILDDIF